MFSETIVDILRAVSSALQTPTILILLLLIAATVIMLGSIIAEFFSERRRLKTRIPQLIDEMQRKNAVELESIVKNSSLLKRQKIAAKQLITRGKLPSATREALARQLIFEEESRYAKITRITDLIAKIAPMFGLMGTLIPLGPGLMALGQGDTKTLSSSLLIAFDTTVAGLISAAVAYVISAVRKRWYEQYMVGLETIMETILEEQNREAQ
ncbi:MotA/TolQ/ExbB proton channel family protein [Zhenpiania hominis]|uniref:MotA/TolQ/ExbB proton channel family protein n=1 Tax=Zhenpiania hominis TaxID=2763644 RepID=UPI0039F508BF